MLIDEVYLDLQFLGQVQALETRPLYLYWTLNCNLFGFQDQGSFQSSLGEASCHKEGYTLISSLVLGHQNHFLHNDHFPGFHVPYQVGSQHGSLLSVSKDYSESREKDGEYFLL